MCIFLEHLKVETSCDLEFQLLYISNRTVLHGWPAISNLNSKFKKNKLKFDNVKKLIHKPLLVCDSDLQL